ncbi:MAG: S1 family peptidase [Nocardioides sp.]
MSLPEWPVLVFLGDSIAGMGFHISRSLCLTCVHVLDPQKRVSPPALSLSVTSALHDAGHGVASVLAWKPETDVAVLRVREPLASDRLPVLQRTSGLRDSLTGRGWDSWGLPVSGTEVANLGRASMAEIRRGIRLARGEVAGPLAAGRVQLAAGPIDAIASGYSGSAVRDVATDRVIGMLTSRDPRSDGHVGFMISMDTVAIAVPGIGRHLGWRLESDAELRAAWRWETENSALLSSTFVGRRKAVQLLRGG